MAGPHARHRHARVPPEPDVARPRRAARHLLRATGLVRAGHHFVLRRLLRWRLARSHSYSFTTDYVTAWEASWQEWLAPYRGRPAVRFLEIGSFEGRSTVWFLQHVLTGPGSTITCVDVFDDSLTVLRFSHNVRVSGQGARVVRLTGRSDDVLPGLESACYDAVYVDGDHEAMAVLLDAALGWRLLKPGGVMIFDDYLWGLDRPPSARPQMAIDLFLDAWGPQLELLHRGYQVAVRKASSAAAPPFLREMWRGDAEDAKGEPWQRRAPEGGPRS